MEEGDVFVEPPDEWLHEIDYKEGCVWKARTLWYGERGASQGWQEFFSAQLEALDFLRGVRDPTKFYHAGRRIYLETHADDGHATASESDLEWLCQSLVERGVLLKPYDFHGIGDSYQYKKRTYRRTEFGFYISSSENYLKEADMFLQSRNTQLTVLTKKQHLIKMKFKDWDSSICLY